MAGPIGPLISRTSARGAALAGVTSSANRIATSTVARRRIAAIMAAPVPVGGERSGNLPLPNDAWIIGPSAGRVPTPILCAVRLSRGRDCARRRADKASAPGKALHRERRRQAQDQRAAKNEGRLDNGEKRRRKERVLQPDNENVVHQIKTIGIGRQIAEKPRIAGSEPQADGDKKKTAGGAGRHETQIGGNLDAE